MMRGLILILIVLGSFSGYTQTAADWWYFGDYAGMHFAPGPSAVTNGQLTTLEGCNAISTPAGVLLFYTDGTTVWNANHAVMTNGTGLTGGGSSTQSGVVVQRPGSSTEYYIFTVAQNVGAAGMRYSKVDMTLSGGLGAVVTTEKNVPLVTSTAEKIAAVKKPGGYWVVTLKLPGDTAYAYEVTASGVNLVPVKSNTGVSLGTGNFYGYLKASVQGDKLCAAHQGVNVLHIFDFNKNTGQVTGVTTLTQGTGGPTSYGVEFSPSGDLLYAQSYGTGNLRQYDLTLGTAAAISASEILLGTTTASGGGAIQLAPDGKMYVCRFGQTFVDVINNPDVQGTGAGYVTNAVALSNRVCRWGFPSFTQAIFGANIESEHYCFGDSTLFHATDTNNVDSLFWDFGDLASGSSNYGTGVDAGHIYSDTGTFEVTLVVFSDTLSDTIETEVFIYPHQTVDLGADTSLCVGLEFPLSAEQPFATYLWHDGSTDSAYVVSSPDALVHVTVYGYCDTVSDSVNVTYYYPFVVDLGADTSMCTYANMNLNPGLPSSLLFHWNTGHTEPILSIDTVGTYSVTVTNGLCTYADTITVNYYPEVTVELGNDSHFCYTPMVELIPDAMNAVSYQWNTGATSSSLIVTGSNLYKVTATGVDGYCHDVDSVQWDLYFEPTVSLGNDTSFCQGEEVILNTHLTAPLEFKWNDGSTAPLLQVGMVGLYWVEVSDEHCAIRDTVIIDKYPILSVSLGYDKNVCEGDVVTLTPTVSEPVAVYEWSDGSTSPTLKVSSHGTYEISVTNGLCSATDQVNVLYFEYPEVDLGNDTALCPMSEMTVDVTSPWQLATYTWNDGNHSPIQTLQAGDGITYWVDVTNVVCTTRDSIFITVRDVPNTDLGKDTAICEGTALELSVLSDPRIQGYKWSNGDSTQSITVYDSGSFSVEVFDGYCHTPGFIDVQYKPVPAPVKLEVPGTICTGEQHHLNVYDPLIRSYLWQDGSTSSKYTVNEEGLYWVKAVYDCGSYVDSVRIDRCECPVWLPSAFNPDGDGNNDRFAPESDCNFISYQFTVYNRWGQRIFYSENPAESWDGLDNGIKAPAGAYAWDLQFTGMAEGKEIESSLSGTVLLMR